MEAFEIIILLLRIAFIFVLYFFVFLVVRAIYQELNAPVRRARPATNQADFVEQSLPDNTRSGPTSAGKVVVLDAGSARTVTRGLVFELTPVTSIGRRSTSTIVLDDTFVSNEHCLLSWRDGHWFLSDAGSSNGTFLNGQPVQHPLQLNWGDTIGVGGVRLRLEP